MLAGALLLIAASLAVAPSDTSAARAAPARTVTASRDAAATRAYLLAIVGFKEVQLANAARSTVAMEAAAQRISGECPGVLAGAPPAELESGLIGPASGPSASARAMGERQRQARQLEDLKLGLAFALGEAEAQPNREASEALVRSLAPLRWRNPRITFALGVTVTELQNELTHPATTVCSDMKSWVSSDYKMLSPATKELASRSEALLKDEFELLALYEQADIQPFPKALAPYENASDRALARRDEALTTKLKKLNTTQSATIKHVEAAVGLPTPKPEKQLPSPKKPPAIARGTSAAGGKFVVRAEGRSRRPDPVGCSAYVTIEESARPQESLLGVLTNGGGTSRCLSRAHVTPEPAVHCSSGLLIVEANLLPTARNVRLLLSNGRTISSRAIRVPARLGGPAGLYYQAVRGPSPIPVSLTELDAGGATVAVLKLPAVVECTKQLVKHLPGGIVTLARGSLPQGPSFTIRGDRYRELGAVHFELKLTTSNEASEGFFVGGSGGDAFETGVEGPEVGAGGVFNPGKQAFGPEGLVFASHVSSGCQPEPYAIVFGVLKARGDTVLARVSGALVPLREAAIAPRLHAGGVLAYGAFSPLPTELLIQDASGKTVASRNLGDAATSTTETCEGEAE